MMQTGRQLLYKYRPATPGQPVRAPRNRVFYPFTTVAKRTPHDPTLPHALWWQAGVYGSVPAVLLWIVARLPAEILNMLFGNAATAAALFNHAGDTVFVTGWLASAVWLWFTRRRPHGRPRTQPDHSGAADAAHKPHPPG
ncbi:MULTISPECIES: hypothetical protein [Cupriavidus]|jgi:hypothetical protein|uniref:hypothetical protein n=1 Tax=Cupriavidus TaxID=106589 RepID=UPI001CC3059B|nr:hypothetical protein [Cupriavidus pauculus]